MQDVHLADDEKLVNFLDEMINSCHSHNKSAAKHLDLQLAMNRSALFAELRDDVKASFLSRLHDEVERKDEALAPKHKLHNEVLLHQQIRLLRDSIDEEASLRTWLQNRVALAKVRLTKRHLKQYEKEGRVLFRHLAGVPPRKIAKELKVNTVFVNNALNVLRAKGRQVLGLDDEDVKQKRKLLRAKQDERRTAVREGILAYIEEHGPHSFTLTDLYVHLQHVLPPYIQAPPISTISYVLRSDFQMRFRATPPAMTRYLDPTYDEKRQWVSRLLTHFMQQGFTIVSVDESHVRFESFLKRHWRFTPQRTSASTMLHGPSESATTFHGVEVPHYSPPSRHLGQSRINEQAGR